MNMLRYWSYCRESEWDGSGVFVRVDYRLLPFSFVVVREREFTFFRGRVRMITQTYWFNRGWWAAIIRDPFQRVPRNLFFFDRLRYLKGENGLFRHFSDSP